jgi:hypothetical protein
LKEKIKKLEATLMPPPILASSVAMIRHEKHFQETPESSARVKGISNLILVTRNFVEENIKKRMSLILDLWDMTKSLTSLGIRIQNTGEYLNTDLKNDEGFDTWSCNVYYKGFGNNKAIEKARKFTFFKPHQTTKMLLD